MGCVETIDFESFPKQGEWIGRKVRVCFKYDVSHEIDGIIVRDDMEEPFRTIIALSNGLFVLAAECQYSLRD
jgi:hypothetical protein